MTTHSTLTPSHRPAGNALSHDRFADALHIRVVPADGMTVVCVDGRLVRHTAQRLAAVLDSLAPTSDGMIVVDLGSVSLLDTVGLGICMSSAHAARSEGCNVVVLPPTGRPETAASAA